MVDDQDPSQQNTSKPKVVILPLTLQEDLKEQL